MKMGQLGANPNSGDHDPHASPPHRNATVYVAEYVSLHDVPCYLKCIFESDNLGKWD